MSTSEISILVQEKQRIGCQIGKMKKLLKDGAIGKDFNFACFPLTKMDYKLKSKIKLSNHEINHMVKFSG